MGRYSKTVRVAYSEDHNMKNQLVRDIITNKRPVYFISPHFDDAVLSAGALMSYLSKKTKVTVVTVFTKADKGDTLSAKQFLRQCGYNNAKRLFADRVKEDASVLEPIADMVLTLGCTDALWRKKYHKTIISYLFPFFPEAQVLYPTYRFHISKGHLAKDDQMLVEQIAEKLKGITEKNAVIFCPIGIGKHVDHLVTRKACERLNRTIMYWSDFPYNRDETYEEKGMEMFSFDTYLEKKEALAKGYKTQYQAMFSHGFSKQPEVFYVNNSEQNG